jgi:hypothetical protein
MLLQVPPVLRASVAANATREKNPSGFLEDRGKKIHFWFLRRCAPGPDLGPGAHFL